MSVDLSDGRTISVPLEWFPRLVYAAPEERNNWRLIGRGHGIHWEDIDEDISVEGLLEGVHSGIKRDTSSISHMLEYLGSPIKRASENTSGDRKIEGSTS